ncbi:MAG: HTTM domain-containing protein, partial [Bacteroidota bacterium]
KVWVAYAFSWMGCLYDLTIPFFLINKSTRLWAYAAVIIFHTLTAILFPIGMFPYIMMATALIFFSSEFHTKVLERLGALLRLSRDFVKPAGLLIYSNSTSKLLITGFVIFFAIQLAFPLRYWLYPGELFWTEEGYRFSWRVMLMEKAGYAQFKVIDENGQQAMVDNKEFLTTLQEKMMATQPDMILQYAHILRDHYSQMGFRSPQVYVDSYVALNGRLGKPLIDPNTDLATITDSWSHKPWILPFENEIRGF